MMSITEQSVIAGIMTFLLYGALPVAIILYVMGTPQRKRSREKAEKLRAGESHNEATAKREDDTKIDA